MNYLRLLSITCGAVLLMAGCSSTTYRIVDNTPPKTSDRDLAENHLLDVGVVVFDSNIPEAYDDIVTENITPEIRRAEANYIANYAKDLLQSTGNWGAVRVLPKSSYAVDVMITGGILHSDGERQVLAVRVRDARGEVWLEKVYETLSSKYHYEPNIEVRKDPFETTYRKIADDMLAYMEQLPIEEIQEIRSVAEMRFASNISPDAFSAYILEDEDGGYEILRMPAFDDPNMRRVRMVREREFLFIDTLDEFYDRFGSEMRIPYQNWRESTYNEAIAVREERNKSRNRLIAGTIMVLGGAIAQRSSTTVTEYAGYASVIGGATEIIGGIQNRANLKLHSSALQELGTVAAKEIQPHTIELENATISLTGTVEAQFEQFRTFIREYYYEDLGLTVADDPTADDEESAIEPSGEQITEEFFQDSE